MGNSKLSAEEKENFKELIKNKKYLSHMSFLRKCKFYLLWVQFMLIKKWL